ncbi:MAG: ABC transporter permease [Bacteroidetes bacterium]|nr:MAG: ABC transporter permease [Bacteroidota bacterium]
MKQTLIFAWRNLWRNKRRTLITISSIVFAVIIASFMRGMQLGSYDKMLNDAIKSTTGHLSIMDKDFWESKTLINSLEYTVELDSLIASDPSLSIRAPQISSGCLASSGRNTRGVLIMGVDPEVEDQRSGLKGKIVEGAYLSEEGSGVVIGGMLAKYLHLKVGDSLVVLGQGYMGMTAAAELEVTGIFDHPMSMIDKRFIYVNLNTARDLFFMEGRLTSVDLVLKDYNDLDVTMDKYISALDTTVYDVRSWKSMNKVLLQQIESDNFFGIIIIGILYLVIGFGIFGTVLMMVMERKREFSVMMALGLRPGRLVRIVLAETIMMGMIGALIGLALSFPVIYYFHLNPIPITGENAEFYREFNLEPILEVAIKPVSLFWQFLIVLILSIVAAIGPVNSISKFNFVSIIRGRE